MELIKYKHSKQHFEYICLMHNTQNSPLAEVLTALDVPQLGYIVMQQEDVLVCAGFLRMLEGGYAMIDTMVTNAELSSEIRHKGLSILVDRLIADAILLELKGIISLTSDTGVINRALTLGFKEINQKVISLEL